MRHQCSAWSIGALSEPLEGRCFFSAAVPDPSFGTGGVVKYPFAPEGVSVRGVAQQPDGKSVMLFQMGLRGMVVRRLNSNGTIDRSFGMNGTAQVSVIGENGYSNDSGTAILVQPDG